MVWEIKWEIKGGGLLCEKDVRFSALIDCRKINRPYMPKLKSCRAELW